MKKHRIVCSALALFLLLSTAGCSGSSDKESVAINAMGDGEYGATADGEAEFYVGEVDDSVKAAYTEKAGDYVNGTAAAETVDVGSSDSDITPEVELPEAGQLTAGEWNDNDNWGFFSNLVNSGTITFPSFGIDPRYRTAVTVKSEDGSPIANAKVRLIDNGGNVLWSSVSDKQGQAFLFASSEDTPASVEIESDGNKQSFDLNAQKGNSQSVNEATNNELEVNFSGKSKLYKQTDIMFIIDSTGSMSDEMLFLQSEFSAITKEIGTKDTRYSVNFYRDEGDDYVTKCNDFTSDVEELQKKLNSENADGGGDTPEAVADILKETLSGSDWSDESVKLAFLIFDAPPHEGTEEVLLSAVKDASEKGIHIIPVVSSNSERDTELFARSLAINTGGTYVFLTDDSGIGDSHLEPIIGSYDVEKLYDIIIRIINDYRQ